jgi:hypothetical protein
MPRIAVHGDSLNELNGNFEQVALESPVFLNSVPKCGSHLMRNIVRMFVPVEQQYHKQFIQIAILQQHREAFSSSKPFLSWGHLLFSDDSAIALKNVRHLLLVRDPYDWVLARTRFFLSDSFQGQIEHIKGGNVSVEEVMNMMIFGIHNKAPMLSEIFHLNAVAWLGGKTKLVHMEKLVQAVKTIDSDEAEEFFVRILDWCGIRNIPADWRERIRVGSDRKQSGTARENLVGLAEDIPDELPDMQKEMVEVAAPGVRRILGYT